MLNQLITRQIGAEGGKGNNMFYKVVSTYHQSVTIHIWIYGYIINIVLTTMAMINDHNHHHFLIHQLLLLNIITIPIPMITMIVTDKGKLARPRSRPSRLEPKAGGIEVWINDDPDEGGDPYWGLGKERE